MHCIFALVLLVGVSMAVPLPGPSDAPAISPNNALHITPDRLPDDAVPRVRRSQQPGNFPTPGQNGPTNSKGSVGGGVQRTPGGTHVSVDATRNLHTSRDGNTRVDAHGHYDRTFNGPGASRPNYNVGVQVQHRW